MQHAMQSHLLGDRLFWAPITPTPVKVLDLGTGTGIWAIDFADIFPSAEVIGTDLSAIQPTLVPPNCRFEIDDAEAEWTWPEESFDYIHNRNFVCAIRDWPKLIRRAFEYGISTFLEFLRVLRATADRYPRGTDMSNRAGGWNGTRSTLICSVTMVRSPRTLHLASGEKSFSKAVSATARWQNIAK